MKYTQVPALYGLSVDQFLRMETNWVVDLEEVFQKATLRTQIQLLGATGKISLSIPVKKHPAGTLTKDIRIDYIQKWQNQHWRSIQSGYGKAPFFEYYQAELEVLFSEKPEFLTDFTVPLLSWIHRQFFPKGFFSDNLAQNKIQFQPDNILYLSIDRGNNGSQPPIRYPQVFGHNFVPDLSVLDFLLCCGPHFANRKTE